jgi:hypothetical protein
MNENYSTHIKTRLFVNNQHFFLVSNQTILFLTQMHTDKGRIKPDKCTNKR